MLLSIENLSVSFFDTDSPFLAVNNINFHVDKGEIVGIVGESGSGKSTAAHAMIGLIQRSCSKVSGKAYFNGKDIISMPRRELRQYQGKEISIIFQEPMTSLDPTMKVGKQVEETLKLHTDMTPEQRRKRALEVMELAELVSPERLFNCYPHELSGGMRQRIMIASALAAHPQLLIADEPTTALDVTIQADILKTLRDINQKEGTAILFISHDLGVIRHLCERVIVMQNGVIVEEGKIDKVFYHPEHPYTRQLLAARPTRVKLKGGGNV